MSVPPLAIQVDREAYKALIELKARSGQRLTKPRADFSNKAQVMIIHANAP